MKTERLYLYLARRDKKGVQVLAVLKGTAKTSRVDDLKSLGLDRQTEDAVVAYAHANRMYWEPWVEVADSYADLKDKLSRRGYRDLPMSSSPVVDLNRTVRADLGRGGRRTMVRKG